MFMAGDKIRIHVYEDPQHRHELYTPNYGKPLEVYEKADVPGYRGESTLGVDWILDNGETVFTPLDDFGETLVTMYRVNALPVDLELDEFARLYAPDPNEVLTPAEHLARSLKRATHAAMLFAEEDDGGTCNFDSPALDFVACGLKEKDAERVIESLNLRCFTWKPFKNHRGEDGRMIRAPKFLVICGFQSGQANRRTRMAEAFCRRLNADGCECMMYYQMD